VQKKGGRRDFFFGEAETDLWLSDLSDLSDLIVVW
jgi:hypothetical protein